VDDASAEASTNAVEAGVVVVASAGNSGPNPYITGSPASGEKAISVAAVDSTFDFPGAKLALSKAGTATTTLSVQNNNNRSFTDGTSLKIVVLRNANGSVSLGCNESEYVDAVITGKLVVALRGTCARVDRAIFGFRHHAAAVALINNASGRGVFEGDIFDGKTLVTIPFFGVQGVSQTTLHADATALINADTETQTAARVENPEFRKFASFSSGGPRNGDGHLKPDISAPGVSTVSTAAGSGNGAETLSGTSMAAPHVAGVAALAVQSHPGWDAEDVRAAIVNTADAAQLKFFSDRLGGSGLVQPFGATRTSVIATGKRGATNVSFGVEQFSRDFTEEAEIDVRNLGSSSATFAVTVIPGAGSPHTLTVHPSTVSIRAGHREKLHVRLSIPAATVGNTDDFRQVSGQVALSPTTATGNGGAGLTVPYFVVPRARSQVDAELSDDFGPASPPATVRLENESRAVGGTADFYAWGLAGRNKKAGSVGLRAVGVQAFDDSRGRRTLVFGVNTFAPWSTAATKEFDILLDVDGDGKPDFDVFGADLNGDGSVLAGVFDLTNNIILAVRFFAFAPTDGSTILLPVRVSDLTSPPANPQAKPPIVDACSGGKHCAVTKDTPRFTYAAQSFDFDNDNTDAIVDAKGRFVTAPFNAFHSSISTGDFVVLAPGARATVPVTIDTGEFALTPALGQMVVSVDNFSGKKQASLLRIGGEKDDD